MASLATEQIRHIHYTLVKTDEPGSNDIMQSAIARTEAGNPVAATFETKPAKAAALMERLICDFPFPVDNAATGLLAGLCWLAMNGLRPRLTPNEAAHLATQLVHYDWDAAEAAQFLEPRLEAAEPVSFEAALADLAVQYAGAVQALKGVE